MKFVYAVIENGEAHPNAFTSYAHIIIFTL